MNNVKLYHVGDNGLQEGEALGRISVVLKADYEAEVERLQLHQFVWLWTHCRAIGMTEKSLSGTMEHDICHFTITQQSELTKARELLDAVVESYHSYEKRGAECDFECQPMIYASVLEHHAELILAHQSPPTTKNLTNQCDGCQAGIPVEVNQYGTPLHRMGCEGKYPDYMACTAKLYAED